MPRRNLMRRQDVYTEPGEMHDDSNPLNGVLAVLNQSHSGIVPSENQFNNAIGTLLGMIGEEKRRRNARSLPGQQPVDVQYPRAGRAIGHERQAPLPATDAPTVAAERGMTQIMDAMNVPEEARAIAPQILNNVVDNNDGTYSSADGSLQIGNREQLLYMIQRTMQEIGEEMERCGGQAVADVGPDLRTRLTTRGADGRRRLITVNPVGTGRMIGNGR